MAQAVVALALAAVLAAQSTTSSVISNIDLSKPFSTREAWRFVATQGPSVADTASGLGEEPGLIQICLRAAPSAPSRTRWPSAPTAAPSRRAPSSDPTSPS